MAKTDGEDWLVVACEQPVGKEQKEERKALVLGVQGEKMRFFKVLVWHSGLEEPAALNEELVAVDKTCSVKNLQEMARNLVLTRTELQKKFPDVTRETAAAQIQVCVRVDARDNWEPLGQSEEHQSEESGKEEGDKQTEYMTVPGSAEVKELLLETRFVATSGEGLTDWRLDRFYSDIQANAWRFQLKMGQLIDALDTDKRWYESRVVGLDPGHVKVHYRGWTSKWDEWLHRVSSRIAPLHTHVRNWRDFQIGDEIMVGTEVVGKRYPEWRNACVTGRGEIEEDGTFQIEVNVDGCKYWVDSQAELLCPMGTHKAVNANAKEPSAVLATPPSLLPDYFDLPHDNSCVSPKEVATVREKMQEMEFAEGDDWCVVDDDFNAESEEGVAATNNQEDNVGNNNRDSTEELPCQDSSSETSNQSVSSECNADNESNGESTDDTIGALPSTTDAMFGTTSDLRSEESEDDGWRFELEVGQLIDALDTDNNWYESRVVALSSTLVKVHYRGWTTKWDEWVERTSPRIAPLHTKVPNWRAFQLHDVVLVGRKVSTKKYPEWRNAVVTSCESCEVDGSLRIEVDVDGIKSWMDAQDELLCPPGTHKALNAPVLTHSSSLF